MNVRFPTLSPVPALLLALSLGSSATSQVPTESDREAAGSTGRSHGAVGPPSDGSASAVNSLADHGTPSAEHNAGEAPQRVPLAEGLKAAVLSAIENDSYEIAREGEAPAEEASAGVSRPGVAKPPMRRRLLGAGFCPVGTTAWGRKQRLV